MRGGFQLRGYMTNGCKIAAKDGCSTPSSTKHISEPLKCINIQKSIKQKSSSLGELLKIPALEKQKRVHTSSAKNVEPSVEFTFGHDEFGDVHSGNTPIYGNTHSMKLGKSKPDDLQSNKFCISKCNNTDFEPSTNQFGVTNTLSFSEDKNLLIELAVLKKDSKRRPSGEQISDEAGQMTGKSRSQNTSENRGHHEKYAILNKSKQKPLEPVKIKDELRFIEYDGENDLLFMRNDKYTISWSETNSGSINIQQGSDIYIEREGDRSKAEYLNTTEKSHQTEYVRMCLPVHEKDSICESFPQYRTNEKIPHFNLERKQAIDGPKFEEMLTRRESSFSHITKTPTSVILATALSSTMPILSNEIDQEGITTSRTVLCLQENSSATQFIDNENSVVALKNKRHCRQFECGRCREALNRKQYLDAHLTIYTGEKPFACHVCEQAFRQKLDLSKHMKIHTGEKPFECPLCTKTFSKNLDLCRHIRTHTGEKPFQCPMCLKSYGTRQYLKVHMRSHTGERPFRCSMCQQTFTSQSHLHRHTKIHTNEKPYECSECQTTFRRPDNLKAHMKAHMKTHIKEQRSECSV